MMRVGFLRTPILSGVREIFAVRELVLATVGAAILIALGLAAAGKRDDGWNTSVALPRYEAETPRAR